MKKRVLGLLLSCCMLLALLARHRFGSRRYLPYVPKQ